MLTVKMHKTTVAKRQNSQIKSLTIESIFVITYYSSVTIYRINQFILIEDVQ